MKDPGTPESLRPWLGRSLEAAEGAPARRVPLEEVLAGEGALAGLPELVGRRVPPRAPLLLVADPDTMEAAGSRAAKALRAAGHPLREALAGPHPHADDRTLEVLATRARGDEALVVAVGAGTVNDLGKCLAKRLGRPLVTVASAASMNGYSSTIAAMTVRGLKVTLPAPCPVALVLDAGVLAAAPRRLSAAGFGDLMSRPVSGADWVLSHELLGTPIHSLALELADGAVTRARRQAAAIGRSEPEALLDLAVALVLSGLSMCVAGVSSPASGGEHLLSHYLDISEEGWGRPPRLHGEQVAVGTLASFELHLRCQEAPLPSPRHAAPAEEDELALRRLHAHLSAEALEELLAEAAAKRRLSPGREERRARIEASGGALLAGVARQLAAAAPGKSAAEADASLEDLRAARASLEADLRAAGAPTRFEEIDVDPPRAAALLLRARHMRRRFTVLDLAADLGLLEGFAEELSIGEETFG